MSEGHLESNSKPMAGDFGRALLSAAIIISAIVGYQVWGHKAQPAAVPIANESAVEVDTVPAKLFTGKIDIRVDGVAQPFRHVSLAAEVGGRVVYKNPDCNDGKFVPRGTVLYQIDPVDYESAVARLNESVVQGQNALREWAVDRTNALEQIELLTADLGFASRVKKRMESLQDRNAIPVADVDQSMRTELAAKLALQVFQNQLKALEARKSRTQSELDLKRIELRDAERSLARTTITAPMDSVVVTDDCEQDGFIEPGKVVAILNDVSGAEVGCQLELDDVYWLWSTRLPASVDPLQIQNGAASYESPELPVKVIFPFNELTCYWQGSISRFGGTGIDVSTRTIPCRVLVEQPSRATILDRDQRLVTTMVPPPLSTGMFVSVEISIDPPVPLIALPATAIHSGNVVWSMTDGRLRIVPVRIARRQADSILIHLDAEGLQSNDRVVVSPLAVAKEGMLLRERVNQ